MGKQIKNMKYINSISTYCDTEEKKQLLIENINFFKKHDIESAIISPLPIPEDIQKRVKYCFITDYNPIFDWPIHAFLFWQIIKIGKTNYKLSTTKPDYGWTTVSHIQKMGHILFNHGYENVIFSIYDSDIKDSHMDEIKSNVSNLLFPSKRDKDFWKVGIHLMCFNYEYFNKFNEKIYLKDYLSKNLGVQPYLKDKLLNDDFNLIDIPVEDKHYKFENEDFFTYLSNSGVKYFISSSEDEEISIVIYNIQNYKNIKINVNDNIFNLKDLKDGLLKTGIKREEVFKIHFENESVIDDITEKFKLIKNNHIQIL